MPWFTVVGYKYVASDRTHKAYWERKQVDLEAEDGEAALSEFRKRHPDFKSMLQFFRGAHNEVRPL